MLLALNARGASLSEALDNPTLSWRTGGNAPWIGQTVESHDGLDAAQSGTVSDGGESWVETTVVGPGPLSFWWKVSSELGYDQFQFLMDDTEQINISGEVPWQLRTFDIPAGAHVLRWHYAKDSSESAGLDRAWLDQVSYTFPEEFAPEIYEQPVGRTVAPGAIVSFSVSAAGLPQPSYQWFHSTAPVSGATNPVLTLTGVTSADAGIYTVVLRNSHGSITSAPATLIVTLVGDMVEAPELTWTIGGDAAWFGQSAVTHDGVDALESGAIVNQQESWVQTRVNGPGVLSFWWRVSSEPFYDGLQFLTNGTVAASLSGEAQWEQQILNLPPGSISLRWRYFKDGSFTLGQDKGWLDEVTYIPNKAPTNLVLSLTRLAIYENDSIVLNGSFFDPDALDAHAALIDWRDGSSTLTNLPAGVYAFAAMHQYKDDDPSGSTSDSYQIAVSVSDAVGSITRTVSLTVSNLPPALSNVFLTPVIFPFDTATLSGTIADTGTLDTLKLRVNWGDSTNVESFTYAPGVSSFLLRHRYSLFNSNVQVTLTASDDDLGVFIVRSNIFVRPFPAQPRVLSVRKGTSAHAAIKLQGSALANYEIQSSADLVHWTTIAVRTANGSGLFEVDEPDGFAFQRRFYRAIWESQSAGMRLSGIHRGSDGRVTISLIGLPGASYRVESSTNCVNWNATVMTATTDSNGTFNFTDTPNLPRKFYRALIP